MERNIQYTIIRIEHEDGYGPFRFPVFAERNTISDFDELKNLCDRHQNTPTPMEDGLVIDYKYKDLFCAFNSMETFNNLCFKDEVKFLLTKGFKVLLLNVSEIKLGKYQALYYKKDIISQQDISSLFL